MLSLTRAQIINQGLQIAGRPDLTSDARLWLNLFLEEYYYNQDHTWLVATTTLAIANGLAFPSDYRAAKSALLVDTNGSTRTLRIFDDADRYQTYSATLQDSEGKPLVAYADAKERKFYFLPDPTSGLSMRLEYFYMPELPDHEDSNTDSEAVVWKLPYQILIDHIRDKAFEYNDDERADAYSQKTQTKLDRAKLNSHDFRGGSSRIKMGKSFRKRF